MPIMDKKTAKELDLLRAVEAAARDLRDVEFRHAVANQNERIHEAVQLGVKVIEAKRALDTALAAFPAD